MADCTLCGGHDLGDVTHVCPALSRTPCTDPSYVHKLFITAPAPKPGWPCPACGGLGHLADGVLAMHGDGSSTFKAGTPCSVCEGSGRVHVTPIPKGIW